MVHDISQWFPRLLMLGGDDFFDFFAQNLFGDDLFGVWRCWSSVGETNSTQHIQHIHILLQNYVFWNVKQNYMVQIWPIFSLLSPNSSITVLFVVLKVTKVYQFPSQDLWSISTFLAYHIVPTLSWHKTTYIYISIYCIWLVVSNMFFFFHSVGNVIIPTDFNSIIFQRGRFKPPTSYW